MSRSETSRTAVLMVAGFGDNASMFDGLKTTAFARDYRLIPFNLPGFGAPLIGGDTTLDGLAIALAAEARRTGAKIVVAHSVASIIAALALAKDSPLETILSLEGNITADDAYFSGTAADYADPEEFHAAFLSRLSAKAQSAPIFARYHGEVAKADPKALWQLGCDARRYSEARHPGEDLIAAGKVSYLYDDANCPASTLDWLASHPIDARRLVGASHWPSIDAPDLLSSECLKALAGLE